MKEPKTYYIAISDNSRWMRALTKQDALRGIRCMISKSGRVTMRGPYIYTLYKNEQTQANALTEAQAKELNEYFPCEDGSKWTAGEYCPPFVWGLGCLRHYGPLKLVMTNDIEEED